MDIRRKLFLAVLSLGLFLFSAVTALAIDLGLDAQSISLSKDTMLEGQSVRIYADVQNTGTVDLKGVVKFFLAKNGPQLGADQPISALGNKEDAVFVDTLLPPGTHTLFVTVEVFENTDDNPGNNTAGKTITVLGDADRDGKANDTDPDDDNDGVSDAEDAFPLDRKESIDSDGDSLGNNKDEDDDNDGTPDTNDALPLNANEQNDTDKDGRGDKSDTDDDGDGISDVEEQKKGLNPAQNDTDGDKVADNKDLFPLDQKESADFDHDGRGDNSDADADNDGVEKKLDTNDLNKGPAIKLNYLPPILLTNKKVPLDLTTSYDPDGNIEEISVEVSKYTGENSNLTTSILKPKKKSPGVHEITFKESGRYAITITAIDDKGEKRVEKMSRFVYTPASFIIASLVIIIFIILIALLLMKKTGKRNTDTIEQRNKAFMKKHKTKIPVRNKTKQKSKKLVKSIQKRKKQLR